MEYVVYVLLTGSVLLNAFLGIRFLNKKNILTTDAKQLLHELTTGGAVVKIEILDTSALFYRSPKG
jgi:hypothetical protein